MTLPVLDGLGRVIQDAIDHWEPRQGLALALQNLAGSLADEPNLIEKAQWSENLEFHLEIVVLKSI